MAIKVVKRVVVPDPYEEEVFVCDCGHECWDKEDASKHQLEHVQFVVKDQLVYCPVDDEGLFLQKLHSMGYRARYVTVIWTGPGWYVSVQDEWDLELFDMLPVAEFQGQIEHKQKRIAELEALTKGEVK